MPSVASTSGVSIGRSRRRPAAIIGTTFLLCFVVAFATMGLGAVRIPQPEATEALFGHGSPGQIEVIRHFELPRILIALLVGSSLAIAGAVIQGVVRNPLAAPDVIGVTKGAGLGAVLLLLAYPTVAVSYLPVAAFLGGIAAGLVVYVLSYRGGRTTPVRLVLVGIMVGAVCLSAIQYVMIDQQEGIGTALIWLTGSLAGVDMKSVYEFLPWVILLVPLLAFYVHKLDLLGLGDEMARGLGVAVEKTRRMALLLALFLASATVAVAGTLAFIGLIAPQMAHRLVGPRHAVLLPAAAGIGALMLLIADAIGRGADPPLELPAGMMTAIIGVPYFVYLLSRST